jgi:hypothetical protein
MKGGLLLDVIVTQGAPILELLAGEDETLLIRRDTTYFSVNLDDGKFKSQAHPSLS